MSNTPELRREHIEELSCSNSKAVVVICSNRQLYWAVVSLSIVIPDFAKSLFGCVFSVMFMNIIGWCTKVNCKQGLARRVDVCYSSKFLPSSARRFLLEMLARGKYIARAELIH